MKISHYPPTKVYINLCYVWFKSQINHIFSCKNMLKLDCWDRDINKANKLYGFEVCVVRIVIYFYII